MSSSVEYTFVGTGIDITLPEDLHYIYEIYVDGVLVPYRYVKVVS